jgi:hypothetical protein
MLDDYVIFHITRQVVSSPIITRLQGRASPVAPAAAASLMSSIVAGRRRGLTMPRKTEAGRFGKRTTLPSACMKNLTRSPGFKPRWSRIAFGIVA